MVRTPRFRLRALVATTPLANILPPGVAMFTLKRCECCGGTGYATPEAALLLYVILDAFGGESFTVAELYAHAAEVGGALKAMLTPYNRKKFGQMLLEIEGHRVDDLRLERLGIERGKAVIWRIVPV